jgi:AraC-like DNA-binding protein
MWTTTSATTSTASWPPRQLLRLLRFERSRRLVRARHSVTMTEVALEAGFYDHAHMLLHEWHRLAGCRPDQWLSEELLSVQAEADARDPD